jgi:hypothetical protein
VYRRVQQAIREESMRNAFEQFVDEDIRILNIAPIFPIIELYKLFHPN